MAGAVLAPLTTEGAIAGFIATHGDLYDYSKVLYDRARVPVTIICKEHGPFEQTPNNHKTGQGCPACAETRKRLGNNRRLLQKDVLATFSKVHGTTYDYSEVDYTNARSHVTVICREHGPWLITPDNHKRGYGCPTCGKGCFTKARFRAYVDKTTDKLGTLYVIRCFNHEESFFKIGITSKTVHKRFDKRNMPYSYEVVREVRGDADFIYELESTAHRLNAFTSYPPNVSFIGHTECFSSVDYSFIP